ncbi:calcium-binding protein [Streptomyces sp. NPDC086787]|uniref:calcium-binding protein n=1 Tax=Streptomyces sp. NPDC086787 TaxID=3365759 RepID=UPI003819FF3B
MFIRSAAVTLSGALVLSALAATAAEADAGQGDTTIVGVVVNGGKAVVVGATAKKTFKLSITTSDDSGIKDAYGWVYHGSFDLPDGSAGPGSDTPLACTPASGSATTVTCVADITVDPNADLINAHAGTWHVWTSVDANDSDYVNLDDASTFTMKRAATLTADASPEPVAKGKTLTVKGTLKRANWDNLTTGGYAGQKVRLQFRKAGTATFTTVKTVTSGTGGALKATAKATADGYWRFSYAGNGTTGAADALVDYVDVR